MPRITQAQAIEQENEQRALLFFEQTLSALPDPRRSQGVRYPLRSVVVIALMAMICGSDDAEAMELWGIANGPWLAGFLELPHGTPSQDVFLSVFAALDPAAFGAVLRSWARLLAARLRAEGKHIAVDGKDQPPELRHGQRETGITHRQRLAQRRGACARGVQNERQVERDHGHSRASARARPACRNRDHRRDGVPDRDRQDDLGWRRALSFSGQG